MTRSAGPREVRLSRLRVADDDARRLHARRVVAGGGEAVDEGDDVLNLRVCEAEPGPPAVGAAVLHHRRDQLAVLVVEDDGRAQQARSAVAAARVRAVAERAVDAVERSAALDGRGIAGRPGRKIAPLRG